MKLSEITEKTKLVRDFVSRLAKGTKQQVVVVDVLRVSRVSGASARPVHIALEGGQVVKIYLREAPESNNSEGLDIFRIDINSKTQPTTGDFDNSYMPAFNASVDGIAGIVTQGQKAFSARRARANVAKSSRSRGPQNKTQVLQGLNDEAAELDKVIANKQAEKTDLETKLEQVKAQNLA
ncbi:hypothetical protein [Psychrobacter sanguinis]|uniref:hypothetical protein n=1 Tax=Psychrobacter sanguinis TaxID=861445 RepID=UPI00191ABCD0|nr:hypothetical protein [Psychrobacter sanguinis]MCC3344518.1 hypothetical protein [Psychrobacter sanguinis]